MDYFKEYVKKIITNQDVKVDKKTENRYSPCHSISTIFHPNMVNNTSYSSHSHQIMMNALRKKATTTTKSTNFEIAITENEEYLKMKLY